MKKEISRVIKYIFLILALFFMIYFINRCAEDNMHPTRNFEYQELNIDNIKKTIKNLWQLN